MLEVEGWVVGEGALAVVLGVVVGVLYMVVRIVTGPGWRPPPAERPDDLDDDTGRP